MSPGRGLERCTASHCITTGWTTTLFNYSLRYLEATRAVLFGSGTTGNDENHHPGDPSEYLRRPDRGWTRELEVNGGTYDASPGLKIPSVSCSDMCISDRAPDELYTFDQAGRCCSDSPKLDVYPICDVTCERARSPYRNHRLLARVTEWKRRVGLYFSHLSHVLQTN